MKISDKPNTPTTVECINTDDNSSEEVLKSKENLAKMVKSLRGNRTIREMAADTGVAPSYISGIENGKFIPSATILMKLASPDSKPQNDVTIKDLMTASGYEGKDNNTYNTVERFVRYHDAIEQINSKQQVREAGDGYISKEEWIKEDVFVPLTIGVIYRALEKKGIHFSNGQDVTMLNRGTSVMDISISEGPVKEWIFLLKYTPKLRIPKLIAHRMIITNLGELLFLEPKPDRKISFVIDDKEVFEEITKYKGKLAFRGDLSVILFDAVCEVINEEYLAHYNDKDTSSELYII